MRSHAKASSAGSNPGRGISRRPLRRSGALAALFAALMAAACLFAASASAIEYRSLTSSFGPGGGSSGGFSELLGPLAFDQGNKRLYALDGEEGEIYAYDASPPGSHTPVGGEFPLFAPGAGEENDIAVDSASHDLYFANGYGKKVYGFDEEGNGLSGFPKTEAYGAFEAVCGVAVDPAGRLWVAEPSGSLIRFTSSGDFDPFGYGFGTHCRIAFDSHENLFVAAPYGGVTEYTAASEYDVASAKTIDSGYSYGLAVDRSTNEIYVVHSESISVYDDEGAFLYEFGEGVPGAEYYGELGGIAIDEATEEVFVSDYGNAKIDVFGPPVSLPKLGIEPASGISATEATVNGTVNPRGLAVEDCHFEVVPASQFIASGYENVTAAEKYPCAPEASSIPVDSEPHAVSAEVSGLEPATLYHYRLVATNEIGEAHSQDARFTTGPTAPLVEEESVEAAGNTDATVTAEINPRGAPTTYHLEYGTSEEYGLSTEESSPFGFASDHSQHTVSAHIGGLSPETAYHFRFVATNEVGATDGEDASFATYPATSPSFAPCPNDQFRTGAGARLPDCRAYEQASPIEKHGAGAQGNYGATHASASGDRVTFFATGGLPTTGGSSRLVPYLATRGPEGWSTDGVQPPTQPGFYAKVLGASEDLSGTLVVGEGPGGVGEQLFVRDSETGSFEPGPASTERLDVSNFLGFAADPHHLIFASQAQLLPSAPAGKYNVYDLDHGALSLVDRVPAGSATSCDDQAGPACEVSTEGSSSGAAANVISPDGSRTFFTASVPGGGHSTGRIYLREDGKRTTWVSASQRTTPDPGGEQPAELQDVTPDGSQVLFTSSQDLTDESHAHGNDAIARANAPDGSELEAQFVPASAAGVAVDGQHVYWAEPGEGNEGEGKIGRAKLDGSEVEPEFITGAYNPLDVAVEGSYVYWTNHGPGGPESRNHEESTIGRAKLGASGAEEVEQKFIEGAGGAKGIAVGGGYLYWNNNDSTAAQRGVARAKADGSEVIPAFVAESATTYDVAVDASHIYIARGPQSSAKRTALDGTEATPLSGVETNTLTVDSTRLYWMFRIYESGGFGTRYQLRSKPLDESSGSEFVAYVYGTEGLAVGNGHLYWSNRFGSGSPRGADLYQFDAASGALEDLTYDPHDLLGAEVSGVLGASEDGSYVYFLAGGVLAPGASPNGKPSASLPSSRCSEGYRPICNLYVHHDGVTRFIARIERGYGFRVSADGSTLVFAAPESLTGYDNAGKVEFFRYSAPEEKLLCMTCLPTGVPPSGRPTLGAEAGGSYFGDGFPSGTPRNLSANGNRFFFNSPDAMVPSDANGVSDVYEWEAKGEGSCESENQDGGCIYLISSGTDPQPSGFRDASRNGDHVFFLTEQPLVPTDQDQLFDVYDAAVGGGLASQHTLSPPTCTSTACQANPAPPAEQTPASATFKGPGNAKPKAAGKTRKCPQGKRKVRRRGKVRCVRRRHRKRHHRHHKRHHRRAGHGHKRANVNRGGSK